jgi:polyphosphate glucokinase
VSTNADQLLPIVWEPAFSSNNGASPRADGQAAFGTNLAGNRIVKVLVVDIGGSSVKALVTGRAARVRFASGPHLTPAELVRQVQTHAADWDYDVVSIGYPGAAGPNGPLAEPGNLGRGWVGYDFTHAFGRPVRMVNDAAMQALGGYEGGRMLFLGLGTGLGSTLVADRVIVPLELGMLPFTRKETLGERLGKAGLARHGLQLWREGVSRATVTLRSAFAADYVVLGGGNASKVEVLPPQTKRGGNADAFRGGFRLWEERVEPHDGPSPVSWRVVA